MGTRTALITGITGQDGSYLADLLVGKGYEVHGVIRRASAFNTGRVDHLFDQITLHHGDVCDGGAMSKIVREVEPDEVYNLAAQSHVRVSFDQPVYTADATGVGALRMLEAVKDNAPWARFYQASSSEMFGSSPAPQGEETPFRPRSPYGCAKLFAHWATINYRESYGMHAACGILFNHESPRRGETFVTRKITRAVGRILTGAQSKLVLGNLDARRDWGFAGDYVEAMWLMLQQDAPCDYVIGTGEEHTVGEFAELAFAHVGLDYREFVTTDPRYLRPAEVDVLRCDATKASNELGWRPRHSLTELVGKMVEFDVELARAELRAKG